MPSETPSEKAATIDKYVKNVSEESFPRIVAYANDPDPFVRGTAATALGILQRMEAIPVLTRMFETDPVAEVKEKILRALDNYQHSSVERLLIAEAFRHGGERHIRHLTAKNLGKYDSNDARLALRHLIDTDEDAYVQQFALRSLSAINHAGLTKYWLHLLSTDDPYARETARRALRKLGIRHPRMGSDGRGSDAD